MSLINPTILDVSTNPINLINSIQIANAKFQTDLSWLEKSFRLAFKHTLSEQENNAVIPRVYFGDSDYYNCLPNDDLQAFNFWYLEDDSKTNLFQAEDGTNFGQEVNINIVFWFNTTSILSGVFDEKIELIEEQIYRSIEGTTIDIEVQQIFRDYPQVYGAFDINSINKLYLSYPYFGFRFNCLLKYNRYCSII